MNVKQVAEYLDLNVKKVYALISEGKIPATKVTGKWLFPRKLVDQWLMESSHGGLLTDRLVITGADDALLQRAAARLVDTLQGRALVGYSYASTELGLQLLARNKADVCGVRWGPSAESERRHAALLRQHPAHENWVLLRVFERQQGIMIAPGYTGSPDMAALLTNDVRWIMRRAGAGAQRQLLELCGRHGVDIESLGVAQRATSERETASLLAREAGDVAPGTRAVATEFGLEFIPVGWEAYDLALNRGIYFRTLFKKLMDELRGNECQRVANSLGGYDFRQCGKIIWPE